MKNNIQWFSIMIGMGLTILIVMSAYVLLAYMIPFMKSVRGVENTSWAYYQAYSGIEQALYHTKMRLKTPWLSLTSETGSFMQPNSSTGATFRTFSSGTTIPQEWYGNSEYDEDFNIISQMEPIQLEIGNGYIVSGVNNLKFKFKVPKISEVSSVTLSWSTSTWAIVNWTVSSENNTLFATWNWLTASDINSGATFFDIWWKSWITLTGGVVSFSDFYNLSCKLLGDSCILKMSVVNDLVLNNNTQIPYLEYKLDFWANSLPDRYTRIKSDGKSYGFQKTLDVRVPQQTVNQAFDFTVFQ